MKQKKAICVFCGASNTVDRKYLIEGRKFGNKLAEQGYHLVFGAGDCGMMGAVARGALEKNGTVTGVFPEILRGIEAEHPGLTETILVEDMHTRKYKMFVRSHAFVILPGGFGTMDETFEVITWKQLHTHQKPVIFYNCYGYWDNWIALTEQFMAEGFASQRTRTLYEVADTMDDIFKHVSCL